MATVSHFSVLWVKAKNQFWFLRFMPRYFRTLRRLRRISMSSYSLRWHLSQTLFGSPLLTKKEQSTLQTCSFEQKFSANKPNSRASVQNSQIRQVQWGWRILRLIFQLFESFWDYNNLRAPKRWQSFEKFVNMHTVWGGESLIMTCLR